MRFELPSKGFTNNRKSVFYFTKWLWDDDKFIAELFVHANRVSTQIQVSDPFPIEQAFGKVSPIVNIVVFQPQHIYRTQISKVRYLVQTISTHIKDCQSQLEKWK